MGGHRDGGVRQGLERRHIKFQFRLAGGNHRKFLVAVRHGAAMTGYMLHRAAHARPGQPVQHRPAQRRHAHRLRSQGPIADDIMRAGLAHVEQRQAIDGNAHFGQIEAQRFRIGARGLDGAGGCQIVKPVVDLARRESQPFRRTHPGDPPAFLIYADEQPIPPMDFPQAVGKRAKLRPVFDIATKQDIAGRIALAEKGPLISGQRGSGNAEYGRRHNGRESQETLLLARFPPPRDVDSAQRLTWQAAPCAFRLWHRLLAPATSLSTTCSR